MRSPWPSRPATGSVVPFRLAEGIDQIRATIEDATRGRIGQFRDLRDALAESAAQANALVGGTDAESYDTERASERDQNIIIPLVLLATNVLSLVIALGVDYNIFLMSRVHKESSLIGTRAGMRKGLAVTGGVITSAGIVLAATFAVLGILPLVALAQVGFLVSFGVLLDALLVRSILVPAITFGLGKRIWWPSGLSQKDGAQGK